jgi:hypothetical protein
MLQVVLYLSDLFEEEADTHHVDEAEEEEGDGWEGRDEGEELERQTREAVEVKGAARVVPRPDVVTVRVVFSGEQLDGEVPGLEDDVDEPVEVDEEVYAEEGRVGRERGTVEEGDMEGDGDAVVDESDEAQHVPEDAIVRVRVAQSSQELVLRFRFFDDDHARELGGVDLGSVEVLRDGLVDALIALEKRLQGGKGSLGIDL